MYSREGKGSREPTPFSACACVCACASSPPRVPTPLVPSPYVPSSLLAPSHIICPELLLLLALARCCTDARRQTPSDSRSRFETSIRIAGKGKTSGHFQKKVEGDA